MRCYSNLVAHSSWPVAGSVGDQAAAFVTAVSVADGERGKCEKEAMDRATKRSQPPPIVLGADGRPARKRLAQVAANPSGEAAQRLEARR